MGQALYRKYRSKNLSEIVGQEHITTTIGRALKTGKLSHAYLFTGPRGVGKTSIARILAHEINGLPYDESANHLDIIEIDAASNRRIDEIRELRDKIHVAPTSAKYKVYIIDEVHMLTREAFNALLKTLEEPPAHAVFILATTEVHKLPETIISRTQRFTFKPIEPQKVVEHLRYIAKSEGFKTEDAALELIAKHGEGSFRDSISLLDQARSQNDTVTERDVQQLLGIPPDEHVETLLRAITARDPSQTVATLDALAEQGYTASQIAKRLGASVRAQLIAGRSPLEKPEALALLSKLLRVPSESSPQQYLELAVLDIALASRTAAPQPQPVQQQPIQPIQPKTPTPKQPQSTAKPPQKPAAPEPPTNPEPPKEAKTTPKPLVAKLDDGLWPQVLAAIKAHHNTLYGVARMAHPEITDTGLNLHFNFAFHQKRVNEAKNKQILLQTIEQLTGQHVAIECLHTKQDPPPNAALIPETPQATPAPPPQVEASEPSVEKENPLAAISSVFGAAEVLES